jgi:haloacetate dehalogenase
MVTKSTTHHRCVANGIKFHFAEAGEGPPVVLLHGFPETSYAWRYQIEALKTRYRLIVPDLRGYGATDKAPTGYDKRTMANDIRPDGEPRHREGGDRRPRSRSAG